MIVCVCASVMKLRLQHSKALIKTVLQAHSLTYSHCNSVSFYLAGMDPNWRHIIPPGQKRVISEGQCIEDCTGYAFPAQGINIFAVMMRTHQIGKEVKLRQVSLYYPPMRVYPTYLHAAHVYLHSLLQLGNSKPMLMSKLTLQIRQTEELPPIAHDSNIDVAYQDFRRLPQSVHSMPGDRLIAECIYDSSSRKAITLGKC